MRRAEWIVSLLFLSMGACASSKPSQSNPDGGSAVDGGPIANACTNESQIYCTQLNTCEPGTLEGVFGTVPTCESRLQLDCETSLAAPSTGQSPTQASSCTSQVQSETCAQWLDGFVPSSCEPAVGTLSVGQPCAYDAQCGSQFCMIPLTSGGNCGTCASMPAVGDPCSKTGCGETLDCFTNLSGTSCQAFLALNATCNGTTPCPIGSSCVGTGASGLCTTHDNMVGQSCSITTAHSEPQCDERLGLYCLPSSLSSTTGTCVQVAFAAANEPCGLVDGGVVGCGESGTCQRGAGQLVGLCSAVNMDGTNCDLTSTNTQCLSPARCTAPDGGTIGTCEVPNGAQCM